MICSRHLVDEMRGIVGNDGTELMCELSVLYRNRLTDTAVIAMGGF